MPRHPIHVNPKHESSILAAYAKGATIDQLKKKYRVPRMAINRILFKHDIPIRTAWSYLSKGFDKTFFKTIDTHEKAYWLGFIYADGNLHGKMLSLLIKDKGHLDKFKEAIDGGQSVTMWYDRMYRFGIKDEELREQMIRLGVIERKSLVLGFPSSDQVPDQFINSFILGYFDGDGCMYVNQTGKYRAWQFTIIATKPFSYACQAILARECDLALNKLAQHKTTQAMASVIWGGKCTKRLKRIYEYLYHDIDPEIPLKRKRDKFLLAFDYCGEL